MDRQEPSDETLMAYADGALDRETAEAVAAAAEADPALARRIATFRRTGDLLGQAGRARPLEPLVPDLEAQLRETIRAGRPADPPPETVVPFMDRGQRVAYRPIAIAASLALIAGLAGGFFLSQGTGGPSEGGLRIAALEAPDIAQALDTVPSGERIAVSGGELATIASFRNTEGEFCREFEFDQAGLDTVVSVACRTVSGWQPRFAVVAGGSDDTGYAPASSLETLDAYLTAIGAGAPLSLEDEAAAMAAGAE